MLCHGLAYRPPHARLRGAVPGDSFVQATISTCRQGTSTAYAAFCDGQGQVHVRPVGEAWTRAPEGGAESLVGRLRDRMGAWSMRTADSESRVVYKGGSDARK